MKKRTLSLMFALMLTLGILMPFLPASVNAASSGICGDDLTWHLSDDGVMTISGEGPMTDFSLSGLQPWWFDNRSSIKSLIIRDGVTSIGSYAFALYGNLTSVTIPDSVTSIGDYAFRNLTTLETVKFPESGLKTIGETAFYGCINLKDPFIPDGIYTIWAYTFKGCSSIEDVRLPKTLLKIDQGAFENCTGLLSVLIPTNVEIIGSWSFKGCTGMKKADMQWADATEIREGAFKNCTGMRDAILPGNIQVLGDSCFHGIGIKYFTVPRTVTEVGPWCFARSSLLGIDFEGDAPIIGEGAFNKIANLTVQYPRYNDSWTSDMMLNYGADKVYWKEG